MTRRRRPEWRPVGQPKQTGVPATRYECVYCTDTKSAQWWARRVLRTEFRVACEVLVCDECREADL